MLKLVFAALVTGLASIANPDADSTVTCALIAEGDDERVDALRADCDAVSDHPEFQAIQAAADQLASQVAMPMDGNVLWISDSFELERGEAGWDLPRMISLAPADFGRAFGLGNTRHICGGRALISASGVAENPEWICRRTRRNGTAARNIDERVTRRMAGAVAASRWMLPLRLDAGCDDQSLELTPHTVVNPPGISEAERPNCNAFDVEAVSQYHPIRMPYPAGDAGIGALCDARFTYDARGVVQDISTTCELRTRSGEAVEDSEHANVRAAYIGTINVALSRTRRDVGDQDFEGLRNGSVEVNIGFN